MNTQGHYSLVETLGASRTVRKASPLRVGSYYKTVDSNLANEINHHLNLNNNLKEHLHLLAESCS